MGFVIWSFTVHEKSSLLVVARNSPAAHLNKVHVIPGHVDLFVEGMPLFSCARATCVLRESLRAVLRLEPTRASTRL